jgi:hemoglobin
MDILPTSPQPETAFGHSRTPYDAIGGESRVRALVDAFYGHVQSDTDAAIVRKLYPLDLSGPRQRLFEFLCGWLGGPQLYVEKYGHPRLRQRHMPFAIGVPERDRWLACMGRAMDDCSVTGELREFLNARFAHVANFMRNQS